MYEWAAGCDRASVTQSVRVKTDADLMIFLLSEIKTSSRSTWPRPWPGAGRPDPRASDAPITNDGLNYIINVSYPKQLLRHNPGR